MSRTIYLFGGMARDRISEEFPIEGALVLDIDPELNYFDVHGPEARDGKLDAVSGELKGIGVTVSGEYHPCRKMVSEDERKTTKVIVLDGEGIDKKYIKAIADRAAGDGIDSFVCHIDQEAD